MRRLARWLILFIVLLSGLAGTLNGPRDLLNSQSAAMHILALAVATYGIAGIISFFAMLTRRSWVMIPLSIWAIASSFAGTFAPLLFAPPESRWLAGISSGITCVILVTLIAIQVHRETLGY